jgi:hypothetical protein
MRDTYVRRVGVFQEIECEIRLEYVKIVEKRYTADEQYKFGAGDILLLVANSFLLVANGLVLCASLLNWVRAIIIRSHDTFHQQLSLCRRAQVAITTKSRCWPGLGQHANGCTQGRHRNGLGKVTRTKTHSIRVSTKGSRML